MIRCSRCPILVFIHVNHGWDKPHDFLSGAGFKLSQTVTRVFFLPFPLTFLSTGLTGCFSTFDALSSVTRKLWKTHTESNKQKYKVSQIWSF